MWPNVLLTSEEDWVYLMSCLKKWANPGPFLFIFRLFKQTIQFFTTNQCEKQSCPSNIWCKGLNSRPLEHESPPVTTGPELPPLYLICYLKYFARLLYSLSNVWLVWVQISHEVFTKQRVYVLLLVHPDCGQHRREFKTERIADAQFILHRQFKSGHKVRWN